MIGEAKYRALLIGVWNYAADSGFNPLLGPSSDVRELGLLLRDPKVGLFTVKELLNPNTGPLRAGIEKFLDLADKNDNLLLYFSGHGESSTKTGQLCLMSAEGDRAALDGSSLSFQECYEWARNSPAQSITIILDCCRAGSAFKGSAPDFDSFFNSSTGTNQPHPAKTIKILTVGSGFENALDAATSTDMSPFTALLHEALGVTAVADENGLVSLSALVAAMRQAATPLTPQPWVWGTDEVEGPYLAQRPQYVSQLLDLSGLREFRMERTGAARYEGRELHIGVEQVDRILGHLRGRHPTTAYVGGPVGSGKTWILCDVKERLLEEGWQVVALQPSREPLEVPKLWAALKKYAACLQDDNDHSLIIIDGIEWSDIWAEFVSGLHQLTGLETSSGVSILVSLETQPGAKQRDDEYQGWKTGAVSRIPSVVQGSLIDFIAAATSPEHGSGYTTWDNARLERARRDLREVVGTDLWAIAHLAPVWHDPAAEEHVIRAVWRDRIGIVTPAQVRALHTVAALSRYSLWCPLPLAASAGQVLIRLGAEYSSNYDSVRLNSGFLARALLARRIREGKPYYVMDPAATERAALPIIALYLKQALTDENRQQEVVTLLRRLRHKRRIMNIVITKLKQGSPRGSSVWELWADIWTDFSTIVQILSIVRNTLAPADVVILARRFCAYVLDNIDNTVDDITLPTLVSGLELLRELHRGRRTPASLNEACDRLVSLAERQLEYHRWPPRVRRRLLRVLRQLKRLDQETIQRIGPIALRPSSPPAISDMILALDFVKLVSARPNNEALRALLGTWDVVTDDLVRTPERNDNTVNIEQLVVRRALARYVYDDAFADQLTTALIANVQKAGATDLELVLSRCVSLDRKLAVQLVNMLNVEQWSRTVYRAALPKTTAHLVTVLGRVRPDLAVRTLRLPDSAVDNQLAKALATAMRPEGDAVSAGILLKSAARLEEQRGILHHGFAQFLCAELGADFLWDTLRSDNRLSVAIHLIEAYALAHSPLLESARNSILGIIEAQINGSGSENGPRLALAVSDESALGETFIADLRARKSILRATMLARMTGTRNAGALAAFHELGVAVFPLIEIEFVNELEESGNPWTETSLFDDLASEGNVVDALRAATAVTTTLALAGKSAPGPLILEAFQRALDSSRLGEKWTNRVLEADDFDLAESLRLLQSLYPNEASRISEEYPHRILRAMRSSPPRVLADLLNTVSDISPDAGENLANVCRDEELIADALDDLYVDGNLFEQAAALGSLASAEDRLFRSIIPGTVAERFRNHWTDEAAIINNPGLIAAFIQITGNNGRQAALQVGNAVNLASLRRRLARRDAADVAGYATLVRQLGDLIPHVLPALLNDEDAAYLLWRAPINGVAGLAEALIRSDIISSADVEAQLTLRLNLAPDRVPMRSRHRHWIGVGWNAWIAAKYGRPLSLGQNLDPRVISSMDPHVVLWALAWLKPETWIDDVIDATIKKLRHLGSPPPAPFAAAAVLAAGCALGKEEELLGPNPTMSAWQHALHANPWWVRALVAAGAESGTGLNEAFFTDWAPWGVTRLRSELTWRSHGWRKVPQDAESALAEMINKRDLHRPAPSRRSRSQ
jgi:caspase domain-containing protein